MFVISEVLVEEEIANRRFACDLIQCKGACCTLDGGRGAPLEDSEVKDIEAAFPVARKYLSEKSLQHIAHAGLFEGTPGNYATSCIDNRDCVFVFYEEGIARCSIEKSFINGETQWRKPISCHLFPIRVTKGVQPGIRYEQISECSPALRKGSEQNVPMYEFLREPLTRKFGEEWYKQFRAECERRDAASSQRS